MMRSYSHVSNLIGVYSERIPVSAQVLHYTNDRTDKIDEMTDLEYEYMICSLREAGEIHIMRKRYRAYTLEVLRQYGVMGFDQVKLLCKEMMGKWFADLHIDELHYIACIIRREIAKGNRYNPINIPPSSHKKQ